MPKARGWEYHGEMKIVSQYSEGHKIFSVTPSINDQVAITVGKEF